MLLLVISGCQSSSTNILSGMGESGVRSALERGDRLIAASNPDGAGKVFQDTLNKYPQHPVLNGRLGGLYFQRGDYERAASYYRTALKSDPNCFHYALTLAQCQGRLAATSIDRDKKMEAAARAYQFAQTLDPQNFTATIELAMCYREIGDYSKAVEILRDAAREHPNAAIIHTQLGEIYHSQNDLDHALDEFSLALKCDGRNLAAHNGCALVNTARAQESGAKGSIARERAVAHLRRSLQINPHQPDVRGMLDRLEPYQWKAVTVTEEAPQ
jgi:tetratricopeptide (TPR) repeat protein